VFEGVGSGGGAQAVGTEVFHGDDEGARVDQDDVGSRPYCMRRR
jgi:hypothetical protein